MRTDKVGVKRWSEDKLPDEAMLRSILADEDLNPYIWSNRVLPVWRPIAKICVYPFSCREKKSLTATDFGSRLARPHCSAHFIASKYSSAEIPREILG